MFDQKLLHSSELNTVEREKDKEIKRHIVRASKEHLPLHSQYRSILFTPKNRSTQTFKITQKKERMKEIKNKREGEKQQNCV